MSHAFARQRLAAFGVVAALLLGSELVFDGVNIWVANNGGGITRLLL